VLNIFVELYSCDTSVFLPASFLRKAVLVHCKVLICVWYDGKFLQNKDLLYKFHDILRISSVHQRLLASQGPVSIVLVTFREYKTRKVGVSNFANGIGLLGIIFLL
jgi:hypothetical protein